MASAIANGADCLRMEKLLHRLCDKQRSILTSKIRFVFEHRFSLWLTKFVVSRKSHITFKRCLRCANISWARRSEPRQNFIRFHGSWNQALHGGTRNQPHRAQSSVSSGLHRSVVDVLHWQRVQVLSHLGRIRYASTAFKSNSVRSALTSVLRMSWGMSLEVPWEVLEKCLEMCPKKRPEIPRKSPSELPVKVSWEVRTEVSWEVPWEVTGEVPREVHGQVSWEVPWEDVSLFFTIHHIPSLNITRCHFLSFSILKLSENVKSRLS